MSEKKLKQPSLTLYSMFNKCGKKLEGNSSSPNSSRQNPNQDEEPAPIVSDDEEMPVPSTKRKRIRAVIDDDDEEEEGDAQKRVCTFENNAHHDEGQSGEEEPISRQILGDRYEFKEKEDSDKKDVESLSSEAFKEFAENGHEEYDESSTKNSEDSPTRWPHESIDFLQPENICDANKRRPDDPKYDPKTLYVPESFLNKQTPAMRQWWVMKSQHMDCVICFKVGKFYELYHMDAVDAVNHLSLIYMKGDFAHSGFPESAYGQKAASLVEQGFKVARVEQTETPEMMAQRCAGLRCTKFDKVVSREICEISMKGACILGAQITEAKQPAPSYMLAIAEKSENNSKRFGVCFVDTSIGIFNLGEFDDDKHSSRLLTLLAAYPPALVLLEKNKCSKQTKDILKNLGDVKVEHLLAGSQFYSSDTTIEKLQEGCYFKDKNDEVLWPGIFQILVDDGCIKPEFDLTVRALGACLWYLQDCQLDVKVMPLAKFDSYDPININTKNDKPRDYMVLDSVTIANLKLNGEAGSLMNTLDHCCTAFGRRLLQQWILRPYCDTKRITDRQIAIKELVDNPELLETCRTQVLAKLPDLERQIAKIHIFGNRFCSKLHPDGRAILYEAQTYSKRKVNDLLTTLKAFETALQVTDLFKNCESKLLKKLTSFQPKGLFVNIRSFLKYFNQAFDHNLAQKDGKIYPKEDSEYEDCLQEIKGIENELQKYLRKQKEFFGCEVSYFGSDKKRYQIEVPETRIRKVTSEYQLESAKKGFKRYSTPTTREFLAQMMQAESVKADVLKDFSRKVFERFAERSTDLEINIRCLMILDVLCSLAQYAKNYSQDICIPKVLPFSDKPVIKIETGRHPCINNLETFVPNDTELGTEDKAKLLVLTGPNMGGKSTLMRQVALIIIMAQMGSYVPAVSLELNVVDRIFTRLGAHDDILKKQSTFYVELSEASSILEHASGNSFVLVDELGRGTSTHDGCAIAVAYVQKLSSYNCRSIFSTHYHSLVDKFVDRPDIQLGHMACLVDNEGHAENEKVTFLYKLAEGACPKSYGFNVARLAGLSTKIVNRAMTIATELEETTKLRKFYKSLMEATSYNDFLAFKDLFFK